MQKKYQIVLAILLSIFAILALFYGDPIWEFLGLSSLLVNSIIINIFVYVGRVIIIRLVNYFLKTKMIRFLINFIVNIIWIVFIFELLFIVPELQTVAIAITSFVVVAVSLTFRERINNIASGILILSSESFNVGDLIETNGIQGIVLSIDLNYTKIRKLNGIISYLPNSNVFNAATKKFTHRQLKEISDDKYDKKGLHIKQYVDKFGKIISKEEKISRYIKTVRILSIHNPDVLEKKLSELFERYKEVFGIKPIYYVNYTFRDRCDITIQIITKDPKMIMLYRNSFLRDILFQLYPEKIFMDWEGDKRNIIDSIETKGGDM
ncbi:MAG: mechanosensitive ion channel [Candidatus Lokiarchaeota archaeon]|nr:mechanosensitive ion channel [Candidatus Lokiarchaeota archaeon]MBD3200518.1 mechanosensitive ion channel [Candidatus Lokiarchaeota archaeon]